MSDATTVIAPDAASAAESSLIDEFRQAAEASGLRYVTDAGAGFAI